MKGKREMKKIIYLILAAVLLGNLTACEKTGNTMSKETDDVSSMILIKNTADQKIKSIGMTWLPDKESISTDVMINADHSPLKAEEIPFIIYENEIPEHTDLSDFGFKLSVVDTEGQEWWIEIYHPIEMGEEYRYVISDEEEGFRIWREQDPVKLDLTLNEQHQLVDFEANSD